MEEIKSKAPSKLAEKMSTKGLDAIISSILFLIFFLTPVFFTGLVAQGVGFEKMVVFYFLVLIGVVAWVTKGVVAGELELKRTPLDWPIIAILVIFTTSTILSINSKESLVGSYGNSTKSLAAVIILAFFFYLVVNNINAKRIKLFFWGLASSTGIVVLYSFFQIIGKYILPMDFTHSASFNPLGSLSALTMYLVIVLPILVVGMAQIKEIQPGITAGKMMASKIILGIITVGAMAILALLNGFTFWPAAIVGMVIVLMFFLSKIIKISSNNLVIPIVAFLMLIILLVLGNFNLLNLSLPAEVSLSRSASWDIAKSSLKHDPLFGTGPSTFYYAFSKYKDMNFNATPLWNIRFDTPSGILYELMITTGGLGVLAFIVLILIALSITFMTLIKSAEKDTQSILLALFSGFLSAVILSILFTTNNSVILLSSVIGVLAISVALVSFPEKFKSLTLSFRSSAKYALALAAIFLCISAGVVVLFTMGLKMYLADIYTRKALMSDNIDQKIANLNQAIGLAPFQDAYYIDLANIYMARANQSVMNNADTTRIQEDLSLAIDAGKRGISIAPEKASTNEGLALIYENASFYTRGALEWAEQHYNKVAELDPNNPVPNLRLALINMARANAETDQAEKKIYIEEAIKKYDEAIAKKDDMAAAFYGKAIAYEKLDKLTDAVEQMKKASLLANDNIDYLFELGRLYFNKGVTQPKLDQNASKELTENAVKPEGEQTQENANLSVDKTQGMTTPSSRNEELNTAEQIFKSILAANSNHANARYSLAVLYLKLGEKDNARAQVQELLNTLTDEPTKDAVRQQFASIL